MGFRMTTNFNRWWWHGLHLLMALLLPLLFLSLISCIKAKEEKEDLGPEVSGDAIDLALSKAVNGASLSDIAVGQRLEFSITRRLENEETVTTLGATRVEVIDCRRTGITPPEACQPNDTNVTYILRITVSTRKSDGTFEVKVSQDELKLTKSPSAAALISGALSMGAEAVYAAQKLSVQMSRKPIRESYHRLREFESEIDPPAAVKNREGCGGLTQCKLQLRHLHFDFVQWYDESDYQKYKLEFTFSIQTPFIPFGQDGSIDRLTGVLIGSCQATYVPVEGRTVYVRDCLNLEDFQK